MRLSQFQRDVAARGWAYPLIFKPDAGQRGHEPPRLWALLRSVRAYYRDQHIELLADHTKLRNPICAIHPHRGLVPTKTTVFIDMVAEHLQRVLAPETSASRRRSSGRPAFQAWPAARLRKIGAVSAARLELSASLRPLGPARQVRAGGSAGPVRTAKDECPCAVKGVVLQWVRFPPGNCCSSQ